MQDLALVLMGVPFFFASASGRGTTKGPFQDDLPSATRDALIVCVCVSALSLLQKMWGHPTRKRSGAS